MIMFLTENDYIVASADSLNIFQQSTSQKREKAEKMAVEEIAGYLRSRYDTNLIFPQQVITGMILLSCTPVILPCITLCRGCLTKWAVK